MQTHFVSSKLCWNGAPHPVCLMLACMHACWKGGYIHNIQWYIWGGCRILGTEGEHSMKCTLNFTTPQNLLTIPPNYHDQVAFSCCLAAKCQSAVTFLKNLLVHCCCMTTHCSCLLATFHAQSTKTCCESISLSVAFCYFEVDCSATVRWQWLWVNASHLHFSFLTRLPACTGCGHLEIASALTFFVPEWQIMMPASILGYNLYPPLSKLPSRVGSYCFYSRVICV